MDQQTQQSEQQLDTLDLRAYAAVLLRQKWVVIATVVLVVATAMGVTLASTPEYEASTRLIVESQTDDNQALQQLVFGQRELETQKELVASRPVAAMVKDDLGLEADVEEITEDVTVTLLRDTQILEIRATSTDPQMAAALAQSFADSYLQFRRDQALEALLRSSEALQQREAETRERIRELETQLSLSDGEAGGDGLSAESVERDRLQNELANIAAQQAALRGSEVFARGGGQVIKPADVPEAPFSPKPLRTGVLAIVLGGMLGVGLAFLRDFLDDAIRSEEQAVRAAGRPALGHIPHWREKHSDSEGIVTLLEPTSPVAEAYRTLKTNIRFASVGRSLSSVLVTSALPTEGKTTTAANLAVAFARAGTRVLLVGADMRRPSVHKAFGIESAPGLSDVLVDEADLSSVIRDVGVPNLRVIPGGSVPPNPAELLGSPTMAKLMGELEQIADVVIYDGPPVLAVADTLEIGPKLGACVLVIDMGTTGRHAVAAANDRLRNVGIPLGGIVLNNLDPSDGYYGYSYYHEYKAETPRAGRSSRRATRDAQEAGLES